VAIAHIGNKDRDGDVFTPDAFKKTIQEKGPSGTNEIWHLIDHSATLKSALSKFSELYKEGDYIVGVSKYKESSLWKEMWPLYESGDINQHSVGFSVVKEQKNESAGYNEITEVNLWEGSAVLWGANPITPTMEVFKSLNKYEQVDQIQERFKRLRKGLKSDVERSLLLIEIKQLEQLIIDDLSTSAVVIDTKAADDMKVLQELQKTISQTFKLS
jgi:HK97 family phage prohead protease